MNCLEKLPENCKETLKIDLINDKKTLIIINSVAMLVLIFTWSFGGLIVESYHEMFKNDSFRTIAIKTFIMIFNIFVYMNIHELVHLEIPESVEHFTA